MRYVVAMAPYQQLGCIGLIEDVHAEDELLEAPLDYLNTKNVDRVLCTGDVADGPGSVARCCELLRQRDVQTVRGNDDRWFLTGVMRDLPEATDASAVPAESVGVPGDLVYDAGFLLALGGVLLCHHGLGLNDMAKIGPDDFGYALEANEELQSLRRNPAYRFIVNGHTHHAMVRHLTRLTVINACTLRRHDNPGFLLVDFEKWSNANATLCEEPSDY